jgi:ADP-ribose pyrophosphatase YjhB (NUDIX family)
MPTLRADVVDVYVARRGALGLEFLQLLRSDAPMRDTWQPIMGHVEAGERATDAALRELREEVGLAPRDGTVLSVHALEQTHPYFLAELDCVMCSPRFVVEVRATWSPSVAALVATGEHSNYRWIAEGRVEDAFLWPGQRLAIAEAGRVLRGCASESHLVLYRA